MKTKELKSQLLYQLKKANIITEYFNKVYDNGIEGFEILCRFQSPTGQTIKLFISIGVCLVFYQLGTCYNAEESIMKCNEVNAMFPLICTHVDSAGIAKIVYRCYFDTFYDIFNDIMGINLTLFNGVCKNTFQALLDTLQPLGADESYDVAFDKNIKSGDIVS